eukprot:TRINITY_DN16720_c0_g1_i1.p1 TRINITY_DN16720_c0_g1~~TRINITY_DN16720_c0_g1_i1.p1  ORF type:complete len:653 (-),score=125.55 TRINITY_DN16720_c0_g1_i1:106-2064(-)
MSRAAARRAVRSQYHFVVNDEEAFSVFGRSEVQEVAHIRQVTDVPCLVAFLLLIGGMMLLDSDARRYGNVLRLSEPIDFRGRLCGYDEDVKDQPLGYNPNPYNDMLVCVSACPKAAADGNFTLPDGPMGKFHTRSAYPTSQLLGQHCLPLDLVLAKNLITTKSAQTELYRSIGIVFSSPDIVFFIMMVPFTTAFIILVMLLYVPMAAAILTMSSTAVTLMLLAATTDLDLEVLNNIPLFPETHPLMMLLHPFFRDACYAGAVFLVGFLVFSLQTIKRAQPVFRECMMAIINKNVLITIFASMAINGLRILFILHITKHAALLMSIVNPVEVPVQVLGELHVVKRDAWSPYFLRGVFFYAFGSFWILEFISCANKYITAQILCQNYFHLKATNAQGQELSHGIKNPLWYALYSLFRYHLGSAAFAGLMAVPCGFVKLIISFFVPDRPNLQNSPNDQYRMAYYLFWPLIQLDLRLLRFFKDSVWVMLPLKGYKYMDAARRAEGLLNRSRGKIPNLTKFTGRIETFLNLSVGLSSMFWSFFLFREPRHGRYHEVQHLNSDESLRGVLANPAHSPMLTLPLMFAFGVWVGHGTLHLVSMASHTLSVCYCIDVEMAGGTETDALFLPASLKEVYKDLGGGESERELSELIEQSAAEG